MIERRQVKATIIKELKHVLRNHKGALKEVLDPYWINLATDTIHQSVNNFNDSWTILANAWNNEILKGKSTRKPLPTESMPIGVAGDYVAKLAYDYANKRFEQLGYDLRLKAKI